MTLLKSLNNPSNVSYIYNHIIKKKKLLLCFFSLFSFIPLAKTSGIMLNRIDECRHSCLVTNLMEKSLSFIIKCDISCRFFIALIVCRIYNDISSLIPDNNQFPLFLDLPGERFVTFIALFKNTFWICWFSLLLALLADHLYYFLCYLDFIYSSFPSFLMLFSTPFIFPLLFVVIVWLCLAEAFKYLGTIPWHFVFLSFRNHNHSLISI